MLNLCIGSQSEQISAQNSLQLIWKHDAIRYRSYLHVTLKIEKDRESYTKISIHNLGLKDPKYSNIQHLSTYNCSQLLDLPRWSLFCDTRDSYYEYFNVGSSAQFTSWISFSRSLNSKDVSIREIILFTQFQDRIMLRVKIKKEQIS